MNDQLLTSQLVFGGVLFALGFVGFMTRRSLILMFLSLEMMLAGVSINLVAFSRYHGNFQGQVLAIMVLTVAACEAAIALALIVSLYRRKPTLDVQAWDELSETLTASHATEEIGVVVPHLEYPKLTPSGLDPMQSPVPAEFKADIGAVEVPSIEAPSKSKSEVSTHA